MTLQEVTQLLPPTPWDQEPVSDAAVVAAWESDTWLTLHDPHPTPAATIAK